MGNQVASDFDFTRSPLALHQRIAYSFSAGDLLTVVLKDRGEIDWGWNTGWRFPAPDQGSLVRLVRNLNAWRRGRGRPFLAHGGMEKPLPLRGVGTVPLYRRGGAAAPFPGIMTSRWTSPDGREAQVLVDYLSEPQAFTVAVPSGREAFLLESPTGRARRRLRRAGDEVTGRLPSLPAVLVELAPLQSAR